MMRGAQTYRTEAIVLRHARLGEADRLLTLFSPTLGKIRAVAKGVLRPTSHLAGHLDIFSRSSLLLVDTQSLDLVTQAQLQESFPSLQEDLERVSQALYVAELLDRLSEEDQCESAASYNCLLSTLRWLSTTQQPDVAVRYFEMQILGLAGYRPELYTCLLCRQPLQEETNALSSVHGGALCSRCADTDPTAPPLSVATLKVLRLLQQDRQDTIRRLRLEPALRRELEALLQSYLSTVLDQEVRSATFVETVRAMPREAHEPQLPG